MKKATILILVSLLLIAGITLLYLRLINKPQTVDQDANKNVVREPEDKVQTVDVTAKNGKFEPNNFNLGLSETLSLSVNAVDQDYYFKVENYPRLNANFLKGETTTVDISSLGVGTYNYSCGEGCGGTITVEQQQDEEE